MGSRPARLRRLDQADPWTSPCLWLPETAPNALVEPIHSKAMPVLRAIPQWGESGGPPISDALGIAIKASLTNLFVYRASLSSEVPMRVWVSLALLAALLPLG